MTRRLAFRLDRLVHFVCVSLHCRLMQETLPLHRYVSILGFLLLGILLISCSSQPKSAEKSAEAARLAGTWVMKSKIVKGQDVPATTRLMKLVFNSNGTFRAIYRGNEKQAWIRAGAGGFSYSPPFLTLFWDSGAVVTILVEEKDLEHLQFHHGHNLVPMKNQEPDEIFVRQKTEKGPTRRPS
jgi:hypothetical protein